LGWVVNQTNVISFFFDLVVEMVMVRNTAEPPVIRSFTVQFVLIVLQLPLPFHPLMVDAHLLVYVH